ncbi:ipa protein [Colletotrichum truncatum]|uniref:Ipa protein n=1 Tax=Colletotrichum truncatum TaxID=5467 RepID=A0ACC3YUC2_COLTU|nr:ipa protein [Colletotrichum truncatum]KAF6798693.1 ipa protein [Colletotrichum truncatum]
MQEPSSGGMVKELHTDLVRKFRKHGPTIEKYWHSFDKQQRTKCIRAGDIDGQVLKHSMDRSLGNVYKFIPEWNLRDLTEPDSDHLMELFRYRTENDLMEQYLGTSTTLGDLQFIEKMIRTKNLHMTEPFKNCWSFFLSVDEYGNSYKANDPSAMSGFEKAMQMKYIIPQETGELVLIRQTHTLQNLNIIIEDILEEGSKTRKPQQAKKKPADGTTAAFSKLKIQDAPTQLTLSDLVASARDQKTLLEGYLALVSSEPVVLAHDVNHWFFSRPELVADELGRRLPQYTDRYISGAVLDAVHNAVSGAAIWAYIEQLLLRLESPGSDKSYRSLILQEITNICNFEFTRAQSLLKRHVAKNSNLFKRISNTFDKAGNARLTMKAKPDSFTRSDPQLHYILRLCHAGTNAAQAVEWAQKLGALHHTHPTEREKLSEGEFESLCNLAAIVGFIQDMNTAITVPSVSRKKRQLFISQHQELEGELNQLKKDLDLGDFAIPIGNLLEPGMAEGALKALDTFIIEKTGTKIGFLYQDLINDCLSSLQSQNDEAKAEAGNKDKEWTPLPATAPEPRQKLVEQRKMKEKTRPSNSSTYEISPAVKAPISKEAPSPAQKFKVSSATADVFTAIFRKSESRRSVSWAAFEGAMADLGFSVIPKYGSVFTFLPPETMAIRKPFTVHRPHKSQIEGYLSLIIAQRLNRSYGWNEETFEVA